MSEKLIAIHHRPGSFSERWIEYCHENNISYKVVDCTKSDIIKQLEGCSGLMWHWDLTDYKSNILSRQLTYSLLLKGIKVYPDKNTSWYYDDKLGQKYLMEAIDAPLVKSYVFYSKKEAKKWINTTSFPKVFKLRGGAGSTNVKLVQNKHQARKFIRKAFRKGFPHKNRIDRLKERIWVLKRDRNMSGMKHLLKGIGRLFLPKPQDKFYPTQKGYVYFQDFIPNNSYDTRTVVVGNRCIGSIRYCRKNDFRASGSGVFDDNPQLVDKKMVEISFKVAKQLGSQSLAFDFIIYEGNPVIVEISYCFDIKCGLYSPGYWDDKLNWHAEEVNLQKYIIQDFIDTLNTKKQRSIKTSKQAIDG